MTISDWKFHFDQGNVSAQIHDDEQNKQIERAVYGKEVIGLQNEKGCTYVNMLHVKVIERINSETWANGDVIPLLPVADQVVIE